MFYHVNMESPLTLRILIMFDGKYKILYLKKCKVCNSVFYTPIKCSKYCSKVCYRETRKDYMKQWLEDNREIRLKKQKEYRETHKEEIAENKRQWRKNNPEKEASRKKKHYEENKEKYRKRTREWRRNRRHNDPNTKVREMARAFLRRCLTSKKDKHTFDILNYSPTELRTHIESLWEPDMNWDNYGTLWNIDHIKPLDAFNFLNEDGSINYDAIKEANALINLRPMYSNDNFSKHAKWTSEDEEQYQNRLKSIDKD